MKLELEGKVALVTGGSEGIGRFSAATLAQEGASVVICARRADVLERAASEIRKETGGDVTGVQADVSVSEQIDRLFDAITETYDGLDILVNNAGRHMSGHFMEMTDAQWYADLDLKLMAAIRCSRLAVPMMRRRGGGRIINITTPLGKAPSAGSVPTSVSRAAGIALTKAMSYDLADDNILVNTVCIGHVKSAQMERVPTEKGTSLEELFGVLERSVPLGRVGETQEAADLIAFLASERASYITGCAINLDGGFSAVV